MEKISLTGANAFYNKDNYEATTRAELLSPTTLPTCHYRYETESKVWRIVKIIFAILLPLIGLYWGWHALLGKGMLPVSQNPTGICDAISNFINDSSRSQAACLRDRKYLVDNLTFTKSTDHWKVKRLTIEVNGTPIDAMIVGKPSTFGNGRWVLNSVGNACSYEAHLIPEIPKKPETSSRLGEMLTALNSNALVFNYPGKGASGGFRERSVLVNTYHAMLKLLEGQADGIAAKEIVMYGHSIGSIVQGEALNTHPLKSGIKYASIKDRPPADLSSAAAGLMGSCAGLAVRLSNWNMSSVASSKKLKCPEIILQSVAPRQQDINQLSQAYKQNHWQRFKNELPNNYRPLTGSKEVIDDGVITSEASLAKQLLDDPKPRRVNQHILGIYEDHVERILDWPHLAALVNSVI